MASLWQQFRIAARSELVSVYNTLIGQTIPTVYTNEPRRVAALPFAVIERVSEVEDQSFDDTDRVKVLDFQVRVVSPGSAGRPATDHEVLCERTETGLRRKKLTLANWHVDKINYQQTLTVQETDDAIVSVLEFTVIGHPLPPASP